MRTFTPEVESALRWFEWTHAIVIEGMGALRYVRVSWPRGGGAGDQDAWLTQALQQLRSVHNAMLREQSDRRTKDRDATRKRHRAS